MPHVGTTTQVASPEFERFAGDIIHISTKRALPPGSRVEFTLTIGQPPRPVELEGKVVSIDASGGDLVILGVRLHNLKRTDRSLLQDCR